MICRSMAWFPRSVEPPKVPLEVVPGSRRMGLPERSTQAEALVALAGCKRTDFAEARIHRPEARKEKERTPAEP
jgi:hypothetical protein